MGREVGGTGGARRPPPAALNFCSAPAIGTPVGATRDPQFDSPIDYIFSQPVPSPRRDRPAVGHAGGLAREGMGQGEIAWSWAVWEGLG